MAIRTYKVTLDTKNTIAPEPVFLRQGDKTGAVVIDATLMDNGAPISIDGLKPMFKANTADGKAVIADSTGFNIVNASGGEFTYQVPSQLGSIDGKIKIAYFSFSDSSGAQSTFNVVFVVEKAADMTQEHAKDWASNLNEIIDQYNQWANDAHNSWKEFVNENKAIIKSVDPGGTVLSELTGFRHSDMLSKTFDTAKLRGDFWDDEIKERAINIKWLGAKGDGVTDDSDVFQSAVKIGLPIFVPAGTYKFSKAVNVDLTTYSVIFGNMPMANWNNSNNKAVIMAEDDYAFVFDDNGGGKSCIDFKNICFQGRGLKNITSSQIIDCEFSGDTGIKNGKTLIIDKSSFHDCTTAGILQLTDSRVSSSTFYSNGVGLKLDTSNDNIIMGNRIEWNKLGISVQGNYNLVFGNNIDRNTTYGIYTDQLSFSKFFGNHIERNLTNNVYFYYGSQISFSNNTIISKHNKDTSDSSPLPNIAIKVHYLEGSSITNNNVAVPNGGKMMEKDGSTSDLNLKLEGNVLNGVDLDDLVANFTTPLTTSKNNTATYTLDLTDLANKYEFDSSSFKSDYLKIIAYSVDSSDSNHYSFNKDTSCGIESDGKPFIKIYSSSSTPVTINGASLEFKINYSGLLSLKVLNGNTKSTTQPEDSTSSISGNDLTNPK